MLLISILCCYGCHFVFNLLGSAVTHDDLNSDAATYYLESNDVFVSMIFHSLDMTSTINIHGICALLAVLIGLLQKYGIQQKAKHLLLDKKDPVRWNMDRYWVFHRRVGYLTIFCTFLFAVTGWISSDYSAWTHFSSHAKYWLFFPYILIILLVLFPIKTKILQERKRIFYHRLFGNLFVKMLYLGPLSRIMISIFQRINVYKRVWMMLGYKEMINQLSKSNMNEYNY